MLNCDYIQKGLLYQVPFADDHHFVSAVELLKKSLAEALVHFYPLAGRLITSSDGVLYIDCNDAGVDLIEASASDVGIRELTGMEISPVVAQLFALDGAINLDGHFLPLLVVQVSSGNFISPRPVLSEKVFQFSKQTILTLKDRANRTNSKHPIIISSFQALCAHLWQAITRARGLLHPEPTTFKLGVNCRSRLIPPLPYSYFSNAVQIVTTTVTAGELLAADISSAAYLLHRIISPHGDASIRAELQRFNQHPTVMKLEKTNRDNSVFIGSSPRFPMYENDFGWGRPLRVRSGSANKFDGKVSIYPAREGGGSVDLEICLLPPFMAALETDPQFLSPICD